MNREEQIRAWENAVNARKTLDEARRESERKAHQDAWLRSIGAIKDPKPGSEAHRSAMQKNWQNRVGAIEVKPQVSVPSKTELPGPTLKPGNEYHRPIGPSHPYDLPRTHPAARSRPFTASDRIDPTLFGRRPK